MSSFPDIEFFVDLVRHGSLSSLARDMKVTPPAVSRRLNQLENNLGVRLLNRSTRRISLTQEGEIYYSRGLDLLADLSDLNLEILKGKQSPSGLIRINSPLVIGREVISEIVYDFLQEFPAVRIHLDLSSVPQNQIEQGFDICIRTGPPPDSRLVARKICTNHRYLCASPLYLEKMGIPSHPSDLRNHQCLIAANSESSHVWKLERGDIVESLKIEGKLSSTDGKVVAQWALKGMGIFIAGDWYLHKYLQNGLLQRILIDWHLPSKDIYVVYQNRKNLPARTAEFIDFLAKKINQKIMDQQKIMSEQLLELRSGSDLF